MSDLSILERRQHRDRRSASRDYIRGIVSFKSGFDTRSPEQVSADNLISNQGSELWFYRHRESKAHA